MFIRVNKLKEIVGKVVDRKIASAIKWVRDENPFEIKTLQNDIKWKQLKIDTLEREKKQLQEQFDKQKQEMEKLKDIIVKEKLNNDK